MPHGYFATADSSLFVVHASVLIKFVLYGIGMVGSKLHSPERFSHLGCESRQKCQPS
jgi:hypothetical protein